MSLYRNFMLTTATICLSTSVMAANSVQATAAPASQTTQSTVAVKTTTTQTSKVNINTASLQELMNIKGMNRLKAKGIVRYRNQHAFKSLDELSSVRGFKKMDKQSLTVIQDQMSVN